MAEWVGGWMDRSDGFFVERAGGRVNGCTNGFIDERMNGRVDGWMDRWANEWTWLNSINVCGI
jgi:nitrate reductase beta subunit